MKVFKNFKLHQFSDGVRFPQNPKNPFMLLYFSENSTLLEDYSKLNLRKMDAKIVVVPVTKIPRTRITPEIMKSYRKYGLYAYGTNMNIPKNKNIIFDVSQYLHLLDVKYKATTYRHRFGNLVNGVLYNAFSRFPSDYHKILLYSIDATKSINEFINRKSFLIIQQLKLNNFDFDSLFLIKINQSSSQYRLLMKDKDHNFSRVMMYLKNIKLVGTGDEIEENIENATNEIVKNVIDNIEPENKNKVKDTISNYLSKDKKTLERIISKGINKKDANEIAATAILYNVNGNLDKSKKLSASVPDSKKEVSLKAIDKNLTDEIIKPQPTVVSSDSYVVKLSNVANIVDKKSPEHIFQKRQLDFETNLKKDMTNSFKVLEKKEVPLVVSKINITPKKTKNSEINRDDLSTVNVSMTDSFGNTHDIKIDIPRIDPNSGTFKVYGEKKCLVNQIVQNPITFLKPYDSKFESSYSAFHIISKRKKIGNHLEIYIGSNKLPLLILLAFSFGFDKILKDYEISYKIINEKSNAQYSTKLNDGRYIVFENVNSDLKKELCNSVVVTKILSKYKIDKPFGSKDYFNDLIISISGRVNSTYQITTNLENIIDPVVRQILINLQLPYQLDNIMKYMASKVVTGFSQKRNDLSNQRIRGSEVLVHLIQKQILAAYTEYKEQVLAGNKNAKFEIPEKKLISEFIQLEMVTNMEYANPIEEMATLTRVTPVGKTVGGIPDKGAIQVEARNVHPSYFGNIDPVDTPEGENIGITQQLTIDALITSARGLINPKSITNKEGSGMLSTSTSMIPFIENTEGARIMLAASQIKQMIPLKNPEPPVVQSGYESILTNVISDSFIKRSPCDGKINEITTDNISILCKDGSKKKVSITPSHLKSGSGKNTLSVFNPKIKVGDNVRVRQILAEGACISNGSIALGKTLLTATMAYKGFNFEDGIVINERLINNDRLTSLHGIEEEVLVSAKDRILSMVNIGAVTKKGEPLLRKTIGEIEQLIGHDEEDETSDISAGQYIKKSPGGKIVDIEVFSNIPEDKFPSLQGLVRKTREKYNITPNEKFTIKGETIKGILIKFKVEQELRVGLGDKLCNRYGNKGIVSLIEKDELMPKTPWGESVDIVTNPLGISNRMIVGQLYEMYCGLISKFVAKKISETSDQTKTIKLIEQVLTSLDNTPNKQYSSNFISKISNMNQREFGIITDQIKQSGFFPIVVPPFKGPSKENISKCLKILGLEPGYHVYLPEFKTKTYHKVPVGYMYFCKLEHIGEMKLHGRSTGPVAAKTSQPLAGKRREGGQRMGEAEVFVLAGNNCPTLLSEFLGPLSDDMATKNEIISEVIQTGGAKYRDAKATPTKDLLNSYFISLMLSK